MLFLLRVLLVIVVGGGLTAGTACAAPPGPHPFQSHPWATCIRHHESDRGPAPHTNGYTAKNPRSSASGAYQFVNGTWAHLSTAAGHGGTRAARDASPWVQDAVAEYAYHHGYKRHWAACRHH